MSLTAGVARAADVPIHETAGIPLISADDASKFLDACERAYVRVLGVEGFRVHNGTVTPDMRVIADLSLISDPAESVAETRRFLRAVSAPDLWFDFTLERAEASAADAKA